MNTSVVIINQFNYFCSTYFLTFKINFNSSAVFKAEPNVISPPVIITSAVIFWTSVNLFYWESYCLKFEYKLQLLIRVILCVIIASSINYYTTKVQFSGIRPWFIKLPKIIIWIMIRRYKFQIKISTGETHSS